MLQRLAVVVALAMSMPILAVPARAIVIATPTSNGTSNPPANELPPATNPYWANVGWGSFSDSLVSPGAGSAVYLGNGFVLTADHTKGGQIIFSDDPFGGVTASYNGGYNELVDNPGGGDSELRLFQVSGAPALPTIPIYDRALAAGDDLMLIGTGLERGTGEQTYNVTGGTAQGYGWASTRDKTWGLNEVTNPSVNYGAGGGTQIGGLLPFLGFTAQFDRTFGDAIATPFDSGSAVFVFDTIDSRWELAGIATAITGFSGKPANTSLYGESTIFIDLTKYASQINAVIPEPSVAMLLGVGALALARRRR